jgi:lysozyme
MKTSKIGIDLIKHFEGLHDGNLKLIGLQPKKCPAGIWTAGYGHAMRDYKGNFLKGNVAPKYTISEIEASIQLQEDLEVFETIVERKIKVPLKQNQFDALVSFTYNTGGSATLFQMVNSKNPLLKDWWTSHYITGGGKVLKGLIERRKSEVKLFFL